MTKIRSHRRGSRKAWLMIVAIFLLVGAGSAYGAEGEVNFDSVADHVLQTVVEWVHAVVDLVTLHEAEGGETANMGFQIEPNGHDMGFEIEPNGHNMGFDIEPNGHDMGFEIEPNG